MRPEAVRAGDVDDGDRIVGDINFFLYPDDDDDVDDSEGQDGSTGHDGTQQQQQQQPGTQLPRRCLGEIDIMIADRANRSRGLGFAAATAFLVYIHRHLADILAEYAGRAFAGAAAAATIPAFTAAVAKIKASNDASAALFGRLGFAPRGGINYFGERELRLDDFEDVMAAAGRDWIKMADGEVVEVEYIWE